VSGVAEGHGDDEGDVRMSLCESFDDANKLATG